MALGAPRCISMIVTTYGTDTLYTQACLASISRWKQDHHELLVVTHDESPLLRAYLDACAAEGLIDRLIFATSGHGHTRGFNLAVRYASSDVVFNICNDILIGPSLIDDCAHKLRADTQLGLIGWHWYNEGTIWQDGELTEYQLREESNPWLSDQDRQKIEGAEWFTGRTFQGLGGPKWICLCNTGFMGVRQEVLQRVGGGFGKEYSHYWADDFLNYAVLDQGLDVRHFEAKFRDRAFFYELQYDHADAQDRRRHVDELKYEAPFLDSIRLLGGGMSRDESIYLHLLARSIPESSVVTNIGVWRGSSAIVLLDAMRSKQATFNFIDCFDLADISEMSGQPPVSRDEFLKYVEPYIGSRHKINVLRANTLDLACFPKSDFVFLDAGHTKECITHDASCVRECLMSRGTAVFHDYGSEIWPDIRPGVDSVFPGVEQQHTVGVFRAAPVCRETFQWPHPATDADRHNAVVVPQGE
jgi:GT2 family glycosyltransferase